MRRRTHPEGLVQAVIEVLVARLRAKPNLAGRLRSRRQSECAEGCELDVPLVRGRRFRCTCWSGTEVSMNTRASKYGDAQCITVVLVVVVPAQNDAASPGALPPVNPSNQGWMHMGCT